MLDALGSVSGNQVQQNPLQPDLQYRGFLASPLLGAPQGLSVYIDGVRLNEPFGDTLSWDLIPTEAVRSANLMPGLEPALRAEHAGRRAVAGDEDRLLRPAPRSTCWAGRSAAGCWTSAWAATASAGACSRRGATSARRAGGRSRRRAPPARSSRHVPERRDDRRELALGAADTTLTGNGPAPRAAAGAWTAARSSRTRTSPTTGCSWRSRAASGRWRRRCSCPASRTSAPAASRRRTAIRRTGSPARIRRGRLRCAGRRRRAPRRRWSTPPATPCRTTPRTLRRRREHDADAAARATARRPRWRSARRSRAARTTCSSAPPPTRGGRASRRRARWRACRQPDRGTVSAGIVDADVARRRRQRQTATWALYATRHASRCARDLFVTAAARFNVSTLSLRGSAGRRARRRPQLPPLEPGARASATSRAPVVGGYAGYSESMRVPTPLELTCASETDPCRLPNGFIADPPLAPVVARTFEVGVRGRWKRPRTTLDYVVAAFRTTNARRHPVHQLGRGRQPRLLHQRRRHPPPGRRGEPDRAAPPRRAVPATRGSNGPSTTPISTRASRRRSRSCPRRTPRVGGSDRRAGGRAHPERARPHRQGGGHLVRGRRLSRSASTRSRNSGAVLSRRRGEPAGAAAGLRRRQPARGVPDRAAAVAVRDRQQPVRRQLRRRSACSATRRRCWARRSPTRASSAPARRAPPGWASTSITDPCATSSSGQSR